MKQLATRLWAKITALILMTVFAVGLAFSVVGIVILAEAGAYTESREAVLDGALESSAFWDYMRAAEEYYTGILRAQKENETYDNGYYESLFAPDSSNFFFTVTDTGGKLLFQSPGVEDNPRFRLQSKTSITYNWREMNETRSFDSEDALDAYIDSLAEKNFTVFNYSTETNADGSVTAEISYNAFSFDTVIITGCIRQELTVHDKIYFQQFWLGKLLQLRNWLIVLGCVCLLAILALLVFLLCAAGRKEGVAGVCLNWVDRIPFDLYLLVMGTAIVLVCAFFLDWMNQSSYITGLIGFLLCVLFVTPLAMGVLMSTASRFKDGRWWRNTVFFYACRLIWRFFRFLWRGVRAICRALPLIWQVVLIWGGLSLIELIFIAACENDTAMLIAWWVLGKCVLAPVVFLCAIGARRVLAGGKALADGDLNYTIDTAHLHLALRQHAENLNSIAGGMQKAVMEQTRAERFRTELITNVSHDIKTPLTSIVNYVDLLKKEDVPSAKAREYIAVLDRQSARLKKLTEDLVEASKASTGAISVSLEPTEVNVLLGQVAGEYLDRLEAAGLEPVFRPDASAPKIMADGRLLWRVFDNLLSNVCKYAMPGTRMYFSSEVRDGKVIITFRNISKYALDISADELMERFVRGDASRSTEGSGLGLSIAQSLTQLQKGTFELCIDGDLFKAIVTFDVLT